MRHKSAICCALLLTGLALPCAQAGADERRDERRQEREERRAERRERMERFDGIGPGEAARRAQARNGGGRVLEVDPMDDGYRVKLLKQGEVRVLMIPHGPLP